MAVTGYAYHHAREGLAMSGLGNGKPRTSVRAGSGRTTTIVVKLAVAVVAGAGVFLLLAPYSGEDSDPPTCYSVFSWVVPCHPGMSIATSLATSVVVAVVLLGIGRRR